MIEGIYALQQWWIDGEIVIPPQVEGRFVLREGTALAFLHDRRAAVPRHCGTLFGSYRLSADTFAYGYDDALMMNTTAAGVEVGEQVPWPGMREFSVSRDDGVVHVRAQAGSAEFQFSSAGFIYLEDGRPLRRWRRLSGIEAGAAN